MSRKKKTRPCVFLPISLECRNGQRIGITLMLPKNPQSQDFHHWQRWCWPGKDFLGERFMMPLKLSYFMSYHVTSHILWQHSIESYHIMWVYIIYHMSYRTYCFISYYNLQYHMYAPYLLVSSLGMPKHWHFPKASPVASQLWIYKEVHRRFRWGLTASDFL